MPLPASDRPDLPPLGRHYRLGDHRLYLYRAGEGRPTAVFLAGAGMLGLGYLNVQEQAAALTTSVLYDRGGTGWSDPVELPRTAADVVQELRGLLAAADLPAPFLFVGHSLGGLYARRYAQLFPSEVAGLLLLDPAHEDFEANQPESARRFSEEWKKQPMPELTPEMIEGYRPILNGMYATWPADVREALVERHLDPARVKTGLLESSNVDALGDEMRSGGPIPAVPVIVYTAMGIDPTQTVFTPEEIVRAQNEAKRITNEAFARTAPGAEHRVLDDASHLMIHIRRPDAVLQGLKDVLARLPASG